MGKPAASCDTRAADFADDLDGGLVQRMLALARRKRAASPSTCRAGIRRDSRASRRGARARRLQASGVRFGTGTQQQILCHRSNVYDGRRRAELVGERGLRVAGREGAHRYAIYSRAARFGEVREVRERGMCAGAPEAEGGVRDEIESGA